jgi:hypothetical protein
VLLFHCLVCCIDTGDDPLFGFRLVVGFVWSNDPESYAGGSVATGRAIQAGQVKGDDTDKKGHPGPPGWAWG